MIYRVTITPLKNNTEYESQAVDVSELVAARGISKLSNTIDNSDYVVGVFSFASVKLTLLNNNGLLSDENDPRSIFRFTRDRARVNISFQGLNFSGLIEEEATREDEDKVKFTVTGLDSLIRASNFAAVSIRRDSSIKEAIFSILNAPPFNTQLNVSLSNIDLGFEDIAIENVAALAGQSSKEVLDSLLSASNSFMRVVGNNLHVSNRATLEDARETYYGVADRLSRTPVILKAMNYNRGLHRVINSCLVEGGDNIKGFSQDRAFVDYYGNRQKNFQFDWVRTEQTAIKIARNFVRAYKTPKQELEILIRGEDAGDLDIGNIVRIAYMPVVSPPPGRERTTKWGSFQWGEMAWNETRGNINIQNYTLWMVYGREDNPDDFTTKFKLREFGETFTDSYSLVKPAIWGQFKWGDESQWQGDNGRYARAQKLVWGNTKWGTKKWS